MDNHPIPQDVTGFQFRLIGDMTVKQFAFVAVGGILAVVFLYVPIPFLLRIPFMIFFGGLGAVIAFVPIEGRPIDQMIGFFLKALVTPNQYAYQKIGGALPIFAYQEHKPVTPATTTQGTQKTPIQVRDFEKERKLNTYLSAHQTKKMTPLDRREEEFLNHLFSPDQTIPMQTAPTSTPAESPVVVAQPQPQPQLQQMQQPVPQPAQAPIPEKDHEKLPTDENELARELTAAHNAEDAQTDILKKQEAHKHVQELEDQLSQIKSQKEQLEKELQELRAQQAVIKEEVTPLDTVAQPEAEPKEQVQTEKIPSVRKISSEAAKALGLPHIPEDPNLILGIIKDPRGNALSNILVEVKDKNGNPARAFRTNQLGHFASATQLPDGTYTIDFEDPKGVHKFDTVEINATGEIIMPIEVISQDERENLRKALFN